MPGSFYDEEDQFIRDHRGDKNMLVSVDMTLADDSLLPNLWATFEGYVESPQVLLNFFVRLIQNRLPRQVERAPSGTLASILDLTNLSPYVYRTFMEIASKLVQSRLGHQGLRHASPEWVGDAALILLAHGPCVVSETAIMGLRLLLGGDELGAPESARVIAACITPSPNEISSFRLPKTETLLQTYRGALESPIYRDSKSTSVLSFTTVSTLYRRLLQPYYANPPRQYESLYVMLC